MAERDDKKDLAPTLPSSPGSEATLLSGETQFRRLARGAVVGRYFVLDLVGEGGMGAVYSAYDPDLGRKVAIKLLKLSGEKVEDSRARLLREAQAMARLSHPNVLPVFDAGLLGEQLFVAMELVEGTTLWGWLSQRRRRRSDILRVFIAAGEGLAAAHAAGLIHRDFKPDNILLGKEGRPRVTDFGLAHVEGVEEPSVVRRAGGGGIAAGTSQTVAGEVAGTPAYMAPEQFAGAATDARTDQFAFCVALWEALTGERPFAGDAFWSIRRSVLAGVPRPPPRGAALPRALKRILLRGLARSPDARFPSMVELLDALRGVRDRWLIARRLAGWVVAAAVLGGVSGFALWRHHQEQARCAHEAEAVAGAAWTSQRRNEVATALAGAKLSDQAVQSVLSDLDERFRDWTTAQAAACEAARTSRDGSALALRCLERRELRAEAVTRLLAQPSQQLAGSVDALLDGLRRPSDCLARTATPASPPRQDLRWLRAADEECSALSSSDRYDEVLECVAVPLKQARALGAAAEAADLELVQALAQLNGKGPDGVLPMLLEAMRDADAASYDELSLEVRIRLMSYYTIYVSRLGDAEAMALDADAWLRRLGSPPWLDLELTDTRADLASYQRHDADAVALYRRAIVLGEQVYGSKSAELGYRHNNLASQFTATGHHAEATLECEAAIRIIEGAAVHSPVNLATAWTNLAINRAYQGQLDTARAAIDRSDEILAAAGSQAAPYLVWNKELRAEVQEWAGDLGAASRLFDEALAHRELLEPSTAAAALAGRARILVSQGRGAEALPIAEEAEKLVHESPDRLALMQAQLGLSCALWATGQHERALAMAAEALTNSAGPEDGFMRGRVEAWVAARKREK
jgi:hypothetical protein